MGGRLSQKTTTEIWLRKYLQFYQIEYHRVDPPPTLPHTVAHAPTHAHASRYHYNPPPLSISKLLPLFSLVFFQLITILPGVLYSYLAEGVGHSTGKGAFRALSCGYVHWASGRRETLEVNYRNPTFCHVRCTMKPSMKDGSYSMYVLLEKSTQYTTTIRHATYMPMYSRVSSIVIKIISVLHSFLYLLGCRHHVFTFLDCFMH